ncbi:GDP-L-fucose synthase 2 [Acanthocystis turfacea Chlorella virus Canal-1]|nr:GDP-L-fucose synthase 2 [Acanthocystis turfacea Chlorella virus Canal-1]
MVMEKSSKIYVAGSGGMVGSAIVRLLKKLEFTNIITRTSKELDLRNASAVDKFFDTERPEYVFLAAAKVGGIHANNTRRGEFIRDNLMIQTNVIHACCVFDVKKMIFLGSSCIYPRDCPQPIKEEYLLTGPLEETNRPYAVAKIAGIEMCDAYKRDYGCDFVSVMPTNLAGPGDNYNLIGGHVFAALIRKFYEAKKFQLPAVVVWGTGSARRDFMHVDDLARGIFTVMQSQEDLGVVNMGSGRDVSIREFAELIREVVGYEGEIVFDTTKPDGTPVKMMDCSKAHELGWKPELSLRETVELVVSDFEENYETYCKSRRK